MEDISKSQQARQDSVARFGRDEQVENATARVEPSQQQAPVSSTLELDFWRTNYQHRPYVEPGASYEEYAPAYRYGWEAYTSHAGLGRKFEDLEPDLMSRWETYRGRSKLEWEVAREAAKDAWMRIEGGANNDIDKHWVPKLEELLQICMQGAADCEGAADKLSPQHAELATRFRDEFRQCVNELRHEIVRRGGDDTKAAAPGAVQRGWAGLKSAIGGSEKAGIDQCERSENAALTAYRDELNTDRLPPDLEVILTRHYTKLKNAHDQVAAIKRSMEG